jgi:LysM repeat protein
MWFNRTRRAGPLPQIVLIIIFAALITAGIFLAVPILESRAEYPAGTFPWMAEGTFILVQGDPSKEVYLIPLEGSAQGGTGGEVVLPTLGPSPTPTPNILPTLGPSPTPPPPPTATLSAGPSCANAIIFVDYVVQAGDTLWGIASRYVTSIALMARYGVSSVDIVPGNRIRIPVGDPACCPSGFRPYVILQGDSMFGIAQKCGTTIANLQQANNMGSSTAIYETQILCVPQ